MFKRYYSDATMTIQTNRDIASFDSSLIFESNGIDHVIRLRKEAFDCLDDKVKYLTIFNLQYIRSQSWGFVCFSVNRQTRILYTI